MMRGGPLPEVRDPFHGALVAAVPEIEVQMLEKQQAEAEIDPTKAGLKLSSTLIGPRRNLALINGEVYTVGSQIDVGKGVVFVVAEVSKNEVVLVRGDQQFALVLPE